MTKSELIQRIADNTKIERGTVEKVCNEVFEVIKTDVSAGIEISIKNFGVFKIVDRGEREGRNPKTGEKIILAAHKSPIFKASKSFKEMAN